MRAFADLFLELEQTNSSLAKIAALAHYLGQAPEQDRLWAMALLSHRRPKTAINSTQLRTWAAEMAAIPDWLFEETYHIVGDLAETVALLLPQAETAHAESLTYWIQYLQDLKALPEEERKQKIWQAWAGMRFDERFMFNKLLTGGLRLGVSRQTLIKALARLTGLEEALLAHRLMGDWSPESTSYAALIQADDSEAPISRPYPFYLAYALESELEPLGDPADWQAEYKWDGIRGQLIFRRGESFVWSRGEELLSDRFPEFESWKEQIPEGTVIDGEILPFREGAVLPFQVLQTRITRKTLSKKLLQEAPVAFKAYDLLEWAGRDIRSESLAYRRSLLEELYESLDLPGFQLSPVIPFAHWDELREARDQARALQSEGLMLKHRAAPYQTGRKKGDWWKWKLDPFSIDAVLIYAQRGHGRRANLYTDYTFAVWNEQGQLVPFTKAYSGLSDAEFLQITHWVNQHTLEKFGPVRSVKAELVFEIAFEGIQRSTRHKSGIALRFPRMLRWRRDKKAEEANTLQDLEAILASQGAQ